MIMAIEPNAKDKNDDSVISERMSKFISDMKMAVENDEDNRIGWKRKLITANNQRLGVKRVSTRPYPGAPNIPLPESDKTIAKQKPNYVMSAYTAKKKCFVEAADGVFVTPEMRGKIKRAEMGMNFLLNNKINLFSVLELGSDYALEKGHCVWKVIERFDTRIVHKVIDLEEFPKEIIKQLKRLPINKLKQFIADRFDLNQDDEDDAKSMQDAIDQFKSGKKVIEFDITEVDSFPDVITPAPEDVTPANYGTNDLDRLERISHEFFITRRELTERALEGIYNKDILSKLDTLVFQGGRGKSVSENDMIEANKNQNEGVIDEDTRRELFRIKEVTTWYQPSDDAMYERWIFTYLADVADTDDSILRKIKYPFEMKEINYIKYDAETKDIRWHASRGIPERIRALQEFMEKSLNNSIIRDNINNNPMYTILATSGIQASTMRFIPGQRLKVKSHDEIRKLEQNTLVDISSERIIQLLKAFAEEYVGSTDQLFRNATNKGGGKTLGEVELGVQLATGPLTLDIIRWFVALEKLYTMLFNLMKERLGKSIFIEGVEITREDFNFPARVIPNGSLDLANRNTKRQKAMQRLQITVGGPQDIITAEDRYNSFYDFYEADDVQDPDRYITRPEIIAQQQQQSMQAQDQVLAQQQQGLQQDIQSKSRELSQNNIEGTAKREVDTNRRQTGARG